MRPPPFLSAGAIATLATLGAVAFAQSPRPGAAPAPAPSAATPGAASPGVAPGAAPPAAPAAVRPVARIRCTALFRRAVPTGAPGSDTRAGRAATRRTPQRRTALRHAARWRAARRHSTTSCTARRASAAARHPAHNLRSMVNRRATRSPDTGSPGIRPRITLRRIPRLPPCRSMRIRTPVSFCEWESAEATWPTHRPSKAPPSRAR